MTNIEIGYRIRTAREKRGLNKKELAQKIQVADSTIKRYEDGEIKKIKMPVIESIANTLHVNPMWIIGKDVSMEMETFEQKWDREVEEFFSKINAFDMQLRALGWSYEPKGCHASEQHFETELQLNEDGHFIETENNHLTGCCEKKCEDCTENESYYLFSNGKLSFNVTINDYSSFVDDSQTFFMVRLQQLLKKSMKKLFTENPIDNKTYLDINAARPRTDLKTEEITDEMRKHDDDIMDDPNF